MAKGPSKEELLHRITEAAAPAAASFGLEVWGVELIGSGRPVARVFVDAPASAPAFPPADVARETASPADAPSDQDWLPPGVTVDQCAEISRMVGLALDVEELFPDAWTLEVSSPGLERPFFRPEQLPPYVGREVDVLLWDPHPDFPGRRKFRGELAAVEDDAFTLRLSGTDVPAAPSASSSSSPSSGEGQARIRWDDARRVRLIHIFPDTSKPRPGKAPAPKSARPTAPAEGGGTKA